MLTYKNTTSSELKKKKKVKKKMMPGKQTVTFCRKQYK